MHKNRSQIDVFLIWFFIVLILYHKNRLSINICSISATHSCACFFIAIPYLSTLSFDNVHSSWKRFSIYDFIPFLLFIFYRKVLLIFALYYDCPFSNDKITALKIKHSLAFRLLSIPTSLTYNQLVHRLLSSKIFSSGYPYNGIHFPCNMFCCPMTAILQTDSV